MGNNCCCHYKSKMRDEKTQQILKNRIKRMIGQLNGIQNMLDSNRYCGDVLIQIAAVESALQSFGYIVLKDHIDSCVTDQIRAGDTEITSELIELIKKLK